MHPNLIMVILNNNIILFFKLVNKFINTFVDSKQLQKKKNGAINL